MRYFLTDLRGNPIYSFAHIRRLRGRSNSNGNLVGLASGAGSSNRDGNSGSIRDGSSNSGVSNNPNAYHQNHYQSSSSYIRQGSYSQHSRRSSTAGSGYNTTVHSGELFVLIRNRSWNEVERRLKKYPHEAYGQDPSSGNTALHLACRLDPPVSIIYALHVNCRTPNAEGATPLHIAASHRCSASAIEALLQVCREQLQQEQEDNNNDDDDDDDDVIEGRENDEDGYGYDGRDRTTNSGRHRQRSSSTTTVSLTSATSDLSRMGRAPIHYACMSFRGLEIEAFQVLLDATIREGNLWMEEPSSFSSRHGLSYDEDDNFFIDEDDELDASLDESEEHVSSASNKVMELESKDYERVDESENSRDDEGRDDSDENFEQPQTKVNENRRILVNVMGLKDATGQTPLALLFRRYRERVRCVITTLDRLRRDYEHDPQKMAVSAAITVHSDLGQLWEKARWIVARLTEERLARDENFPLIPESKHDLDEYNNKRSSSRYYLHGGYKSGVQSPGEAAVAQEAALWATEQQQLYKLIHRHPSLLMPHGESAEENLEETVTLPLADDASLSSASIPSLSKHKPEFTGIKSESFASNDSASNRRPPRKFRIVHASVGLTGYGCPPELIRLAISIYPHQVTEMDEDGNLPLHIAATAASHLAPTMAVAVALEHQSYLQNHNLMPGGGAADDHSVISDAAMSFFSSATVSQTTNPFDKVIKMLLQQYPQAARIPHGRSGQLPLVMAVESGRRTWEDGLRTLMNAYPPALHNKKLILEPSFYPHILALVANNGAPHFGMDGFAIFDFVQQQPSLRANNNHASMPLHLTSKSANQQKRRQLACSRTTLFDLLRTKPEWITKGYDDSAQI